MYIVLPIKLDFQNPHFKELQAKYFYKQLIRKVLKYIDKGIMNMNQVNYNTKMMVRKINLQTRILKTEISYQLILAKAIRTRSKRMR